MKRKAILGTILLLIIIAGTVGAILSSAYVTILDRDHIDFDEPKFDIEDLNTYLIIKGAIATINVALSAVLIFLYITMYQNVKSHFTLSLIIAMSALFVYAITSSPLLTLAFGFRPLGLGPFTIIPDLFATIALINLTYVSLK